MVNPDPLSGIFNGKTKLIAGIIAAIFLAMMGWLFSTVITLQMTEGRMDDRIITMRTDFEAERTMELNFQSEVRLSLQSSQSEMRAAVQRVADILTEVRIRLGEDKLLKK